MPREKNTIKPNLRIVHAGTAAGKTALQPLGKAVHVTPQAKELMEDFRLEACAFGAATATGEVERHWMNMQMRFHECMEYIAKLEHENGPYKQTALMQF